MRPAVCALPYLSHGELCFLHCTCHSQNVSYIVADGDTSDVCRGPDTRSVVWSNASGVFTTDGASLSAGRGCAWHGQPVVDPDTGALDYGTFCTPWGNPAEGGWPLSSYCIWCGVMLGVVSFLPGAGMSVRMCMSTPSCCITQQRLHVHSITPNQHHHASRISTFHIPACGRRWSPQL